MIRWWENASVAKKLYAVVGLMAALVVTELFTIFFAMATLSSVRAFVAGEGLWSKAQKNAIHNLYQFALTRDENNFKEFQDLMQIPAGDRTARLELLKPDFNREVVRQGFLAGANNPDDIDGMIDLLVRFNNVSFVKDAVTAWTNADAQLDDLRAEAANLRTIVIDEGLGSPQIKKAMDRIARTNSELTKYEIHFSAALGAGSRWLESFLKKILVITAFSVELTGILLTFRFTRHLVRTLKHLRSTATAVGRGDFSAVAPVRSKDELGQTAEALNKMTSSLRRSILENSRTTDTLRRSEQRYRTLVEAISEETTVFMLDLNGVVTTWDPGSERIMGYTRYEVIGKNESIFYSMEDVLCLQPKKNLQIALSEGRFEAEMVHLKKNGTTLWANVVVRPTFDQHGKAIGFSKVIRDITRRKEYEVNLSNLNMDLERRVQLRTRDLMRSEAQVRLIANSMPVLIAQLDINETFLFVNDAFCSWFTENQQFLGKTIREVIGEERYGFNAPFIKRALKGESVCYERRSTVKAMECVFNVLLIPEFSEHGEICGCILVATDVSNYKAVETELINAKRAADVANEAKSAFLANMSHEIRTPLTAILGYLELLLTGEMIADKRAASLNSIKRNGKILSDLIDDILDLSKVEAGMLEIDKASVALSEMLAEINSMMGAKSVEKGLQFSIDMDSNVPTVLRTDWLRLRQILINIIGNAIKFTDHGSVTTKVRLAHPEDPLSRVEFVITDTGRGINPDQQERIFAPFTQADPSTTRKYGGTGLGLGLSKKLAQALGGDVILTSSKPGEGSTFIASIANERPDTNSLSPIQEKDAKQPFLDQSVEILKNRKILVVDDSEDNQELVKMFFAPMNAQIEIANNGEEGVIKAFAGSFDVILLDLQMPVMDGYQAIQTLRKNGYHKAVIALTAHAMEKERNRCIASGFDDYISKPINRSLLVETVCKFARQTEVVDVAQF